MPLLAPTPALAAGETVPGLIWGLPFAGLLLTLALFPVVAPRLWHRRMGLVVIGWSAALLLPWAIAEGPASAWHLARHALMIDYLPFIALLVATYAIGGGILIEGGPWGTAAGNTALMALACLLSGILGPLAVSMVMIHPLLRANVHRRHKVHLVVFFIVLVCNVGGVVTPLGNPPLYIGLLRGVPFTWPLRALWEEALVLALPLLGVFWLFDRRSAAIDPVALKPRRLHMRGPGNVLLLGLLVVVVLAQSAWHPGDIAVLGQSVAIERFGGALLFLGFALLSALGTPLAIHQANMFNWEPMKEVAKLFAGIFITIMPAIAMLDAGLDGPLGPVLRLTMDAAGQPWPAAYFWLSGILSAFLDNAPTYYLFFSLAGGDPAQLTGQLAVTLAAMSAGSVCFGALTYIGNAPNLMVRGVAAHRGVRMPGFFGYMALSVALLLPGFVVLTQMFFV
jgi:Na+/H+ antiporter NhaD/arsenite permease-like protein